MGHITNRTQAFQVPGGEEPARYPGEVYRARTGDLKDRSFKKAMLGCSTTELYALQNIVQFNKIRGINSGRVEEMKSGVGGNSCEEVT
jgi:hypothetical protein